MRFEYTSSDLRNLNQAQENCFLLTNGLGGYMSTTVAFSVNRNDQGILISSEYAPNKRTMLVHRMKEELLFLRDSKEGEALDKICLSSQQFSDGEASKKISLSSQEFSGAAAEEGCRYLTSFVMEDYPIWKYQVGGVSVTRKLVMPRGQNAAVFLYEIDNSTHYDVILQCSPFLTGCPKGQILTRLKLDRQSSKSPYSFFMRASMDMTGWNTGRIRVGEADLYVTTDGDMEEIPLQNETLYYAFDERDGRDPEGLAVSCIRTCFSVEAGERKKFSLIFDTDANGSFLTGQKAAEAAFSERKKENDELVAQSGLNDPIAQALVIAADSFVSHKESTGGKTILAGYPFFGDWGRDTMISLPGCLLTAGRWAEGKSILKTFLAYEKRGLLPNLFPEGDAAPMHYNSVDAPLLLINAIWLYLEKKNILLSEKKQSESQVENQLTNQPEIQPDNQSKNQLKIQNSEDMDFLREAWPIMKNIVEGYQKGTDFGIHMDTDGLIEAGYGKYQLTWMDVCVDGFLPTPRHGKPVEINAYWYNALCIMAKLAPLMGENNRCYKKLAGVTRESFRRKFWIPREYTPYEAGYLRDVLSTVKEDPDVGDRTYADKQIRCNQVFALALPFTMLDRNQEKQVLETVRRELLTTHGLRTLSRNDPEFKPVYLGNVHLRDRAYHQGTVWPFPVGSFYLAYLRVYGDTKENTARATAQVRKDLASMEAILREGCIGQIAEIYDGACPGVSRGCFAQAWSVGELLRVYEKLEELEI